jgi:hypothetical protein
MSLGFVVLFTACSSTKPPTGIEAPAVTAIGNQKLVSNFTRKGVKLEWDCSWYQSQKSCRENGNVTAIEITAYATSNGNSENNREDAFKVAEMKAKAKFRRFINEEVSTSEVTNVLTKNIEKANDKIRTNIGGQGDVVVNDTDKESSKDDNVAVRENANDIVRTITETIRVNAQGILQGMRVVDEKVVDRQTVQVTIRWDKESEKASDYFRAKFR